MVSAQQQRHHKMSKAPVYYALAQAQFNPVNAMAKYIDEVQDVLRLKGYTLFDTQKSTQLSFDAFGHSPTKVGVVELITWRMTKPDRSAGFVLSQSFLTYHTTNYETHEEFLPELVFGLKAVHQIVKFEHLSRLGLRYLNAILPIHGETVDQYLVDGVHGMCFDAKQRCSLSESVFDTHTEPLISKGMLVNRVHRLMQPLGYPPDISPTELVPIERFTSHEAVTHAMIDIDHFIEGLMPLDFDKIEVQLNSLHASIRQAFHATITDHAKAVWTSSIKENIGERGKQ